MSLKLKLGGLVVILVFLFIGLLWFFNLNVQQLETVTAKRQAKQSLLNASKGLSFGKVISQLDLLSTKHSIINQIRDDISSMQSIIKYNLQLENKREIIDSLHNTQVDLIAIDLLLQELTAKLSKKQVLVQHDILKLEQLEQLAHKVENLVTVYEKYLDAEESHIEEVYALYTNISIGIMLITISIVFLILYFNILRPVATLSRLTEEILHGNYDFQVAVKSQDELGKLASSFNLMSKRLQDSFTTLDAQYTELQHLSKLKDEFLANTSHELRTPLNGIIGLAESLIDGVTGKLPELTKANLAMIVSSGKRLSALVNDILDFSKLKHQSLELQLKPIRLREIVEMVLILSKPLIAKKPLQLLNNIDADLPATLADENRLQQILHNLVSNAIKFTETGQVEISAKLVDSQSVDNSQDLQTDKCLLTDKCVLITVSDTGIGIPADKLESIFESFEQVEGSTSRKYGGTGLGLAVTRKLVELHGSKIWVESTLGTGSKFIFTLPVSEEEPTLRPKLTHTIAHEAVQTEENAIKKPLYPKAIPAHTGVKTEKVEENATKPLATATSKILIVDDEPVNLQVLQNYLSLQNYNIVQATSGHETLKFIDDGFIPDVILLDVMMPQMTGYEVTHKLREKWQPIEMPILLLTAKNRVEDLVQGLEAGANDYMTKPISKEELLARVKTHLSLKTLTADLNSVTKASQTIAGEIVLSRLLEKMMHIVIENAGAERGFLLLPKGEQWVIEAEGAIDKKEITTLHSLLAENHLPEAIISYVARTQENVLLADAIQEGLYTENPYIKKHLTQSVLCFPIVYQQKLRAILYLENNLMSGAFTEERINVLKMLSCQIAISLENAQFMAHLDAKVKERTTQLNTNIEELTQTRQELVQSEKMASLGRLVAGFAHELNTPLGVAVGSASALLTEAKKINSIMEQEEVDVDELLSALEGIDKGANLTLSNLERAASLVSSFKRTAVDQTSDEVRSFQVKEVINDTINTLHNRFKKTDITIQVDCPNVPKIKSLPGALEQIMTNFLMNSLIHGFNEGQNAGIIKINVQLDGEHLHLEYSDNGKGITQENLEKIFEPFFTTHRAHGGSGLGMYICYNIVTTQLLGTITCESTLGKGVVFKIDYPCNI